MRRGVSRRTYLVIGPSLGHHSEESLETLRSSGIRQTISNTNFCQDHVQQRNELPGSVAQFGIGRKETDCEVYLGEARCIDAQARPGPTCGYPPREG